MTDQTSLDLAEVMDSHTPVGIWCRGCTPRQATWPCVPYRLAADLAGANDALDIEIARAERLSAALAAAREREQRVRALADEWSRTSWAGQFVERLRAALAGEGVLCTGCEAESGRWMRHRRGCPVERVEEEAADQAQSDPYYGLCHECGVPLDNGGRHGYGCAADDRRARLDAALEGYQKDRREVDRLTRAPIGEGATDKPESAQHTRMTSNTTAGVGRDWCMEHNAFWDEEDR